MWQTITLFAIQIISVIISVWKSKYNPKLNNKMEIFKSILLLCVVIPFVEEAVFRSVLKNYLMNVPYNYQINAIIFGLAHATNYYVWNDIYVTLWQVACTTFLGYYIVQFESFHYAWFCHMYHNLFVMIAGYIVSMFWYPAKQNNDIIKFDNAGSIYCTSKTCDDHSISYYRNTDKIFMNNKKNTWCKFIPKSAIDKEVLKSIEKFNSMENSSYKNLIQ